MTNNAKSERTASMLRNLDRLHKAISPSSAPAPAAPSEPNSKPWFFDVDQAERGATSPLGGKIW
jgi:hypothetical protein